MTTETIEQMENRWALLMAAKDAHTGRRLFETDPKYARETQALRVQIEERKAAEASRPQISQQQIAQLEWLDRLQGATDANGNRLYQPGSKFARELNQSRTEVLEGKDIGTRIGATEQDIAQRGITLPVSAARPKPGRDTEGNLTGYKVLLPTMADTPTGVQAINTQRDPDNG